MYMPISTEGSDMPTTRPEIGTLPYRFKEILYVIVSEFGGGGELFTCPYPLKVQTCPPRDQRPALLSRVSGQG